MTGTPRLAVSEALYLKPLIEGLDGPGSPFDLQVDFPAAIALNFSNRPENFRGAFLSPIDYARHGGEYQIVPGISAASAQPTGTIRLFVNHGVKDIRNVSVDIRVTSEIILAKILLLEKFPNISPRGQSMQFLPMLPDPGTMLAKADAALVVDFVPEAKPSSFAFSLDLVEEWNDLTGLPYVHGFWVVREGHWSVDDNKAIQASKERGMRDLASLASRHARPPLSGKAVEHYLSSFKYDFGREEEEGLAEFFRYSYFHGAIKDIPDLSFVPTGLS